MDAFKELLEVSEILNSPGGCAWDNKQTFLTLQPFVIEEAHELIEAVDEDDNQKIIEELGDLLYVVIFYCKVAAKQGRFTFDDVSKWRRKSSSAATLIFLEMSRSKTQTKWSKIGS